MFWSIAGKEFLDNMLNLRFIVGLLLCVFSVLACVIILTSDYQQRMNSYHAMKAANERFIDTYASKSPYSVSETAVKPPGTLHPFVTGLTADGIDMSTSFYANPVPDLFPTMDLVFIVSVLLSLLAVLFSYDAFSGEREQGTLRLIVSNPVSRGKILLHKWLGGMASLLVPFALSLLAGTLYVVVQPDIRWDGSAMLVLILVIGVSITFISIFYLLGLMVSATCRHSHTSIVTAVSLWVLLVLVVPSLSPFLAAEIYPLDALVRREQEQNRLYEEREIKEARLRDENENNYRIKYGRLFLDYKKMSREEKLARVEEDAGFKKMDEDYLADRKRITRQTYDEVEERMESFNRKLELDKARQKRTAKNLAALSPLADYLYAVTDLTETGLHNLVYFNRVRNEYWEIVKGYRKQKNLPTGLYYDGSSIDFSDHPRFTYREEPVMDRLSAILPWWGVLLMFNVLMFAAAYFAFYRYDVR